MTVYTQPFVYLNTPCAVALGYFDGVHRGHTQVISAAVECARKNGIKSVVWTFDTSPKTYFSKEAIKEITSSENKKALFERLGVDILITFPFDSSVSGTSCEDFVNNVLKEMLKAQTVFCGFNYSFGAGGKGNAEALKALCEKQNISVNIIQPVTADGDVISSSRIRSLISEGNVEQAAILLGRPFGISGKVISGRRLGRRLGFPTVNQQMPENITLPKFGVYITKTPVDGNEYYGITNIGTKPTVNGDGVGVETNLFGFEGDLYEKDITVFLLRFLREEKKFGSVEELKAQIALDRQKAENYIKNEKEAY